jgi:signal transduction histidine kinase
VPARIARSSIARLALLYTAVLAASMVVVLGGAYVVTSRIIERESEQLISVEAQGLADDFREKDLDAFVTLITDRADDPWVRGGVYELRGPSGDFLAGNVVALPDVPLSANGWTEFEVTTSRRDEDVGRRIRARVTDLGGGFRLLVGRDVQDRQAFRRVMLQSLAWAVLATLLFGVLGGWWLGRRISRAASAISDNAARIASGAPGERLQLSGSGDEIDGLLMRFNELLDRVDALTGTMRAVLDSTAHDLRGHLNRIRGAAQNAANRATTEAEVAATAAVLTEIDRLGATLQGLLRIAVAESGTAPLEDVDLSAEIRDLVELYEPTAPGLFEVDLAAGLHVLGHRQLLAQAFANLIVNALKYAPGTKIAIRLTRDDGFARLKVSDGGPGIPAELRELAVQRFRRLPGASGLPGSGLGLSLVAAVARLHHARLALGDNEPGLSVTIELPIVPESPA